MSAVQQNICSEGGTKEPHQCRSPGSQAEMWRLRERSKDEEFAKRSHETPLGREDVQVLLRLGGAATCSEGFVICFIKVPLAYLNSMAAAVYPNSLWNSQKNKHKTFGTSGRPTQYKSATLIAMSIKSCPRPDGPPCSSSITNEWSRDWSQWG